MKTILIIDDDEDIGDALSFFLKEEGYHIKLALSGEEGLLKIISIKPDLILLDWQMPHMSGIEVLTEFLKLSDFNKIPVILMSANIFNIPQAFLNVHQHLSKPFHIEKITKIIEQVFTT